MTAGVVRCLVKAATVETTVAAVGDMSKVGARSWVLRTIIVAFNRRNPLKAHSTAIFLHLLQAVCDMKILTYVRMCV